MTDKKIEQKQEEELVTVGVWSKIKALVANSYTGRMGTNSVLSGEVKFLEDGSRIEVVLLKLTEQKK